MNNQSTSCPCCSGKHYVDCCGRYLDADELPDTAEKLMRSRYTAYTMRRQDYLLKTWHLSTRPESFDFAGMSDHQWLDLTVQRHDQIAPEHATVEFIARFKVGGQVQHLHEISRFVREGGQWFYVDGEFK